MGQLSEENKENIVKQVAACSTINLTFFQHQLHGVPSLDFFAMIILEIFTIITIIRIMIIKPIFSVGRDHRPWGGTCSGKLATSFGIVITLFRQVS